MPDPDRVVLRKAVLTGVPVKCHKRKAVIAGMFHNAEDVDYFRPIELWTKYGKVGHITESLGTRGRMKCIFNGPVQQNDTVCLSLYTRQFPPWVFPDAELRADAEQHARAAHVPLVRHASAVATADELGVDVGHGPIAPGL